MGHSSGPSRSQLALAGVRVGAGESGAWLLKGGGASRRLRARAFFVRAKKTGLSLVTEALCSARRAIQFSCVFVGSTAADSIESIIADRRTALPLSQPRICSSAAQQIALLPYPGSQQLFL